MHPAQPFAPNLSPLTIYTDASKTNRNVGTAWVVTLDNYVIDLEKICRFIRPWLRMNQERDRVTRIISDSQSAVTALNSFLAKYNLTLETLTLLAERNCFAPVEMTWTKGHSNKTGNEVSDMLARKRAIEAGKLQFAEPFWPINTRTLYKMAESIINKWQEEWSDSKRNDFLQNKQTILP